MAVVYRNALRKYRDRKACTIAAYLDPDLVAPSHPYEEEVLCPLTLRPLFCSRHNVFVFGDVALGSATQSWSNYAGRFLSATPVTLTIGNRELPYSSQYSGIVGFCSKLPQLRHTGSTSPTYISSTNCHILLRFRSSLDTSKCG